MNGDAFESKSRRDKESGAELHWGREWWKLNSLLDGKKIDSITRMRQGARGTRGMEKNKISFVKDTIKERDSTSISRFA